MAQRVFIASSRESVPVAYAIQDNLEMECECTVWDQGMFRLSEFALESLSTALQRTDSAVFVFSPDDISIMRGAEHRSVRDNVIFEMGLFIGKLGRDRCFVVMPKGIEDFHIPTDLVGISITSYDPARQDGNLKAALAPASHRMLRQISEHSDEFLVSWYEYEKAIDELVGLLSLDAISGGFRPQLIVGICRGGALAADLLSRRLNNLPMITLWADRDYSCEPRTTVYDGPTNPFNRMDFAGMITAHNTRRILVVDDFCKTGASLAGALAWIRQQLKTIPEHISRELRVKTAVIAKEAAYDADRIVPLDYCIYPDRKRVPYGRG